MSKMDNFIIAWGEGRITSREMWKRIDVQHRWLLAKSRAAREEKKKGHNE